MNRPRSGFFKIMRTHNFDFAKRHKVRCGKTEQDFGGAFKTQAIDLRIRTGVELTGAVYIPK